MKIKIKTDSINIDVYGHYFHPDVDEGIEEKELLKIRKITISSHNELNNNDIYNVDLKELDLLKNLSSLTIVGIKINDEELETILALPKLNELCFHGVKFNIKNKKSIEFKNFQTLTFSDCDKTDRLIVTNIYYLKLIGENSLSKIINTKILDLSLNNIKTNMLDIDNVETIKVSKNVTEKTIIILNKKCNNLIKVNNDKDIFKLYILFSNIYNNYPIDDEKISQEDFEELVSIAKKFQHPFEALFRIALNYSNTDINFDIIETYMIDKLNADYLLEVYSIAGINQLDDEKSKNKLSQVKDKEFLTKLSEANWLLDSKFINYINKIIK